MSGPPPPPSSALGVGIRWWAAGAIALAALVSGIPSLPDYGTTSDAPALFYAGDRTLFWIRSGFEPSALDFRGESEPAGFHSPYDRRQADVRDPQVFPVFPALVSAATSALFHERLGWLDHVDGHHLGLLLLHAVGLLLFGGFASRLLGTRAGIAAAGMLALFPSAVGHSFNNPKDWPCALFYGVAVLAAGCGVVEERVRTLLFAGTLAGVALASKFNGHFVSLTLLLWAPWVWLLQFRGQRAPRPGFVAAALAFPCISLGTFVALWPWLYYDGPAEGWRNFSEHIAFMLGVGLSPRLTWTDYPLRVLVYMTPPAVLALAALGLVAGFAGGRAQRLRWALVCTWLGLPLLRIAAPRSDFYDANRHFLEYVPALCCLAGLGFDLLTGRLTRMLSSAGAPGRRYARPAATALPGLALAIALAWPVVVYHPYEAAYFNVFAGGLGGAQRRVLLRMEPPHTTWATGTEGDYWWSSARDAARFIESRGLAGSIGVCHASRLLWKANLRGGGEGAPAIYSTLDGRRFTRADYIYIVPRANQCPPALIEELRRRRPVLHRVERDGGLIYEILGPRRGGRAPPSQAAP